MPELEVVELDTDVEVVRGGGRSPLRLILGAADQVVDGAAPTADPTFDRVVRLLEELRTT